MPKHFRVFTGNAHPGLAELIVNHLGCQLGQCKLSKFANQETSVEIKESVREEDVYIIQSGCGEVNDSLMELLVLINACKTASARKVTAVLPYFPYSKQSKKKGARGAIPAKLVANMLKVAGVDQIITIDLHASQIQGFFDIPVDNLFAEPFIIKYIYEHHGDEELVIVSKNAGGAKRVTSIADRMNVDFAIVHKEQKPTNGKKPERGLNDTEGMVLVGNVAGKCAVIVDDMMDGCKTFVLAANLLRSQGARKICAIVTHGILSGSALQILSESPIDEVVVSNTIPQDARCRENAKLKVIDISPMLAEAIRRLHNQESVSYLFENVPF
eukprot:Colp12_sorted_trinity150504_noHs@8045